mmetsp:Transcript_5611/g.8853  ORF Transcript_5611/g.8853 Transcript_5611/m.8853 type:complete len:176 (+) Transcript_5611:631-1158(+)|eukprot:CAMPEP_0170511448 /NCGR_PEP_ID=MMETSP0208-20121228/66310_1 /TAXON_ID=197538 /ORGANISM="Strombidium inclinatum, Strain S3" /LENGTH=175 /DNA_ID=CAMNT_0010794991 /DNA_START=554 /DNA_END=1081 /DNA_ORIENTATION=-
MLNLEIDELNHKLRDVQQEAELSKAESERILLQQEKKIAADKGEVATYKQKCQKSLAIGQQLTTKQAKYEQLQLVIAKSIREAAKGIEKLKSDNNGLIEGIQTTTQQIQNETKRDLERQIKRENLTYEIERHSKDIKLKLASFQDKKREFDSQQEIVDAIEIENATKSNEYRLFS